MKTLLLTIFFLAALATQAADTILQELTPYTNPKIWDTETFLPITRAQLRQSLDAARQYYLAQQRPDGNFTYAMDIATGDVSNDDNQVRQAGAIWGLVCLHKAFPTDETRKAIVRALDFVSRNTRQLDSGETVFAYPGDDSVKTGTIALLCLAIMDFQDDPALTDDLRQHYKRLLFSYFIFLRTMEMDDGSWARTYSLSLNYREPDFSPYYDGESLLAYTVAAHRLKRPDLLRRLNAALPKLIRRYTIDAWKPEGDDDLTKGFYQWGSMAFAQYCDAGWPEHASLVTAASAALAWWQIRENQLESRKGNTAYAVEGLAAAYHIAVLAKQSDLAQALDGLMRRLITRLTVCQFQGPLMQHNVRFRELKSPAKAAAGGITDHRNATIVRIDIVQHQVHAILLMLQYLPWQD